MKIRKAVSADAAVIAEFNFKLALETEGLRLDAQTVRKGVAAVFRDETRGIYYVAETPEGEVAGQLMITHEWSDWRNGNIWWIQSVYVKEAFRGRRVFPALFSHVKRLAAESPEVCALRLYVEKHNGRAISSYLKLGLKETAYEVLEFALR